MYIGIVAKTRLQSGVISVVMFGLQLIVIKLLIGSMLLKQEDSTEFVRMTSATMPQCGWRLVLLGLHSIVTKLLVRIILSKQGDSAELG